MPFAPVVPPGSLLLLALLVPLASAAQSSGNSQAAPDIFPQIPEVRAAGGVARLAFDVVLDSNGKPAFEYGGIVGVCPTIRVEPGDTIALTVRDALPAGGGMASDVNVHFHGLMVAPRAPGDETIHTLARTGQTLEYRVVIPRDHEPGLYWYHPHVHGQTYAQVSNGMSGAIVVEGLQQHLPALRGMRERIIVLRDVPLGPNVLDDDMPMNGMALGAMGATPRSQSAAAAPRKAVNAANPCRAESALQPTLNQQLTAHIGIRPGERQLFRVVNASASRYFDLSVDGSMLGLVARDGVPLDAYPGTPPMEMVTHILLAPAARAEFVVTGTAHPSFLRSACFNSGATGDPDPEVVLATLVDPLATPLPASASSLVPAATASRDLSKPAGAICGLRLLEESRRSARSPSPIAIAPFAPTPGLRVGRALPSNWLSRPLPPSSARRTIRFSEDANGFYIDGKAYAMGAPPSIVARSGTVETWTLLNETDEVHDFHIHQVHFVTDSVDGVRVSPRMWTDTVNLPPRKRLENGRYRPGTVVVIIDFRNPIVRGTFPYHCHILDHEDQGMMALIKVI